MALREEIDTKALLATVDLVEVVGRYVELKKDGVEFSACCPFHGEKTPSFKVVPSKQFYHCFGCGANGDAIRFVQDYEQVEFRAACEILGGNGAVSAKKRPIPAAKAKNPRSDEGWVPVLPVPDDAFSPPRAHPFRGEPMAVYPYRDAHGRLSGYTYRLKTSDGGKEVLPLVWARNLKGEQKWCWLSFPEPRPLYGLHRLAKHDGPALIVEGEKCVDVASSHQDEFVVVSWPGGGKAATKADWSPLAGKLVAIWPDCDAKRERPTKEESLAGVDPLSMPLLAAGDQPGMVAARTIAERLLSLDPPAVVNLVTIPVPGIVQDGWDVADAVDEGLSGQALVEFVRKKSIHICSMDDWPGKGSDSTSSTSESATGVSGSDSRAKSGKRRKQAKNGPPSAETSVSGRIDSTFTQTARAPEDSGHEQEDGRPQIKIGPDRLVSAMQEAERVLFQGDEPPFYERGGILMRIARIDRQRVRRHGEDGSVDVTKIKGSIVLAPVIGGWLRYKMMQTAQFVGWNEKAGEWLPKNLPKEYPESYMDCGEWWAPRLRGIVEAPVLRSDGSVFSKPGYDHNLEIYLASDEKWKPLLRRKKGDVIDPLKDEAMVKAYELFDDVFGPFSPETPADMSVLIAAVLTGLMKTELGASPGFILTAPVFGSGKGKVADIISIIISGREVPMLTMPEKDEKELKKSLFSSLLEGDRMICIDEVKSVLASATLDSMLTQSVVTDRVLGVSKTATVRPTETLFLALGNNITVHSDSSRRWLRGYLNPQCADPHLRNFERDAIQDAKDRRVDLVWAGLTILHAYMMAGCPDMGVRLGSFERWARIVPSAIVWMGMPDPCKTQEAWKAQDIGRQNLQDLLEAWHQRFGDKAMTVGEVCRLMENAGERDDNRALSEILHDICGEKKGLNHNRLGIYLRKNSKRVLNSLQFVTDGEKDRAKKWLVVRVTQ